MWYLVSRFLLEYLFLVNAALLIRTFWIADEGQLNDEHPTTSQRHSVVGGMPIIQAGNGSPVQTHGGSPRVAGPSRAVTVRPNRMTLHIDANAPAVGRSTNNLLYTANGSPGSSTPTHVINGVRSYSPLITPIGASPRNVPSLPVVADV
jgi:hypothetical protein